MIRTWWALTLVSSLTIAAPAFAAAPRLGVAVNISNGEQTHNEVTLAVNPLNPNNLIAGWNSWESGNGVGFSYSFDGGKTWAAGSVLPHVSRRDRDNDGADGDFQVAGDPAFAFGPDGTAYAVVQAFNVTPPFESEMLALRSTNGGRTWSRPMLVSGTAGRGGRSSEDEGETFSDRQSVAVDGNSTSPYRGTVYVAWGGEDERKGLSPVLLSALRPGQDSFSAPVVVSDLPAGFTQNATVLVGPDGAVYVTSIAYDVSRFASGTYISRSTDGGRHFSAPHWVAPFMDPVEGRLPNSDYRVFSFSAGAYDRVRQRLIVAWNDRQDGVSAIFTSSCRPDDLDRCSAPARVTPQSTGEQFFPALSAASNGRVDLLFYDRSQDPENRLNFLSYAFSEDGGASWETLSVTRTAFDGDAQTTPGGTHFIGDYLAVASTNTAAYLSWTGNGKDSACACNQEIFVVPVSH